MALELVEQLRDLAKVQANREFIVKDHGCLPGLVSNLKNDNKQVVYTALEALYYLSKEEANKKAMSEELELMTSICKLMKHKEEKINKIALSTYINIQSYSKQNIFSVFNPNLCLFKNQNNNKTQQQTTMINDENSHQINNQNNNNSSIKTPLREQNVNIQTPNSSNNNSSTKRNKYSSGPIKRFATASNITIYISELKNEEIRKRIESILLRIKGVISFLIDLSKAKVVVRSFISPDKIVAVLDRKGFQASLHKFSEEEDKENTDEPDYLDESDDEEEDRTALVSTKEPAEEKEEPSWFGGWGGKLSRALWG
eukprot:TRINITY_DN3623_c0_g1_i1.p1 TRINITY_DN3623_c0_g1~~TRINITY_DN3623_c0_g1_i1.p1  ORF type:complete len:313 (+),score=101.82 TRINITY_DN3623_c0_g1_i1:64-1002(+)